MIEYRAVGDALQRLTLGRIEQSFAGDLDPGHHFLACPCRRHGGVQGEPAGLPGHAPQSAFADGLVTGGRFIGEGRPIVDHRHRGGQGDALQDVAILEALIGLLGTGQVEFFFGVVVEDHACSAQRPR